ncbi:hypothetical protein EDM00_11465 [Ornithobacterium rhinotracheale]|uniref:hypothetical protein n=1 Tax=Ornithobacterium rhinotracheale TaxID=28251 RepID=UPI00129CB72F|nr:hypothetical protein [Ornithobacterium rhinotracheale]MRI64597.1 hypothetical protein [Ornithobacterium rhinotracheale]MRJ11610.1 hypothetical protein [Ornithobacterium rhinotracheale]
MELATQFVKDINGKKLFAILPIEEYNKIIEQPTSNIEDYQIPEWHKEILDKEMKLLKTDNSGETISDLKRYFEEKHGI